IRARGPAGPEGAGGGARAGAGRRRAPPLPRPRRVGDRPAVHLGVAPQGTVGCLRAGGRSGGMTTRWAILTGESPAQPGGVADYTALVARGLADAGDGVTVYAPRLSHGKEHEAPGVSVVRLPDHFGPRGLLALDAALARRPRPDRILIQYVP